MQPLISVVIPSYNQGRFIGDAIESLVSQAYPRLEIIVIDGGSKDGTLEIIRQFESRLAHWSSEPDRGQTDALIKGFARSSGDVQCWLNSDDLLKPDALHEVGACFENHRDVDVVFGDSEWVDIHGTLLRRQREMFFNRFIWLNTYNYLPGMSVFWRRTIFDKVGGLDPSFDLAMDADLWARFADANARFMHVPRLWSQMRFYGEQKNQRLRHKSDEEDEQIRSRYYPDENMVTRKIRRAIARSARVAIRAAHRSYGASYTVDLRSRQGFRGI